MKVSLNENKFQWKDLYDFLWVQGMGIMLLHLSFVNL